MNIKKDEIPFDINLTKVQLFDLLSEAVDDAMKFKKENELLKEELTNLKNDITRVYNTMISLEQINKHELSEEIEEI